MSEGMLIDRWRRLPGGATLITGEGGPLRVVYPGRANDDRGADLREAIIDSGAGLQTGDIEFHVKSSNWRAHGHHLDPAYNRVVLHVVYSDDAGNTILQSGGRIPTLALEWYMPRGRSGGMPCRNAHLRRGLAGLLDDAGDARFLAKAAGFQRELAQAGAGEVLYRGIMGALGYVKNKAAFVELARQVPLSTLEPLAREAAPGEERLALLQALLLGSAGLLPSQRSMKSGGDSLAAEMERLWAASHWPAAMARGYWHTFKVRPGNLPSRRLAGMGYLLLRFAREGIFNSLMDSVKHITAGGVCKLAEALTVTCDAYWASHLDLDVPGQRPMPALVGGGRANEIVVNVLLPMAAATGEGNAIELYRGYPRLEMNTLERHMRQQLKIDAGVVASARRQQGLLHIYKTLCSQGRCGECRLGDGQSGS